MRWAEGAETHALGEVDVDAVVVDEHPLHLQVGLLAVSLVLEFNKCVLETVAGPLVTDDLAREDLAEAAEDQIEIFVCAPRLSL